MAAQKMAPANTLLGGIWAAPCEHNKLGTGRILDV